MRFIPNKRLLEIKLHFAKLPCLKIKNKRDIKDIRIYFEKYIKCDLDDFITKKNSILLIDDAQLVYHVEEFWMNIKCNDCYYYIRFLCSIYRFNSDKI